LYETFEKEDVKAIEIERNDLNEYIWKYSNPYIYEIIKDKIEKHDNIQLLSNYLEKSEEETIDLIKSFIKYTKEGKIIVNQNNIFCKLKDGLYNEGSNNKEKIPEELKDIAKILGFDIRQYLVHESMGRICEQSYSYKEICLKIDELMIKKYRDSSNFSDKNFKKAANSLLEEYFDVIGEEKAKEYFPETYSQKDGITLNVIYDKQQRKNMTEFGKLYGSEAISKLLNNPKLMKYIIDEKFSDFDDSNKQFVIGEGTKSIKVSCNPDLVSDENTFNFYKSAFNDILSYSDDFDFENPVNIRTGISGEAYIYELLSNSGKYKSVKWLMLDETGKGQPFEYKGKTYNIVQDYSHYDILVETYDNQKLYIEVKSTKREFGNKVPFFISKKQIEMMETTKSPDKYILAVVFDVMYNPKHFFMVLSDS